MDAQTRSYRLYAKTEAGATALKSARGALSSSARQLLILIDGRRSVGDLSNIFGEEALARSLALLESRDYVQLTRHIPEANEGPVDGGALAPKEIPAERADAVPRRRSSAPVLLGALVAIAGIIWLFTREGTVTESPEVSAAPVHEPAAPTPIQQAPTPAGQVLPPAPNPEPHPAPVQRSNKNPPAVIVTPVLSKSAPAPANPAPGTLTIRAAATPDPAPAGASGNPAGPQSVADGRPTPAPALAPVLHVRNQVMPRIPKLATDLGIDTGRVVVVLHVNPKGTVERVELVSATPPQVYDQDMQQVFEKWTFDPLGVPGRMTVQVDLAPHE
jgi:TonB family protein